MVILSINFQYSMRIFFLFFMLIILYTFLKLVFMKKFYMATSEL